jgi:hypothetical protein
MRLNGLDALIQHARLGMRSETPRAHDRQQRCPQATAEQASEESAVVRQSGGARRDRTDDLLLAKQALSQLSYGPVRARSSKGSSREQANVTRSLISDHRFLKLVGLGRLELPTSRLSSARSNQLSYKPAPGFRSQSSVVRTWSNRYMVKSLAIADL